MRSKADETVRIALFASVMATLVFGFGLQMFGLFSFLLSKFEE